MSGIRGHKPFVIENFAGLWKRGDPESAPSDHFTEATNIQYFNSGVETRPPIDKYLSGAVGPVLRVYDYVTSTGQSLLILIQGGTIYHVVNGTATLILSITTMTDFGFVAIAGNAYITPFKIYTDPQGVNYELGIKNEFLYVYKGDGTPARKAAGFPPVNGGAKPFLVYNSIIDGQVDAGLHALYVVFDVGQPGPTYTGMVTGEFLRIVDAPGFKQIELNNIPVGPPGTVSRSIVMSKVIPAEKFYADLPGLTYYRALDLGPTTPVNAKINLSDAELGTVYTPGVGAAPVTTALTVSVTNVDGFCDLGFHLIGVVYETDTGYLTAPGPEYFGGQTYVDTTKSVRVSNIPVSPSAAVKKRHLVSTKEILTNSGDQKGYQFFFIPGGNIDDNTTTMKLVNYYDSDLIADASHLMDNFSEIPAGVNLNTYHSRLVIVGEFGTTESLDSGTFVRNRVRTRITTPQPDNRSVARVSAPGEPEAISKIDGLIIAPLDGNPLTNCQEFRDVLYLFKKTRTYAYSDNQDEPGSWVEEVIDQGVGVPVHGIATVLDSGGVNVDFLLIADLSGLMVFNGVYARPEMSWKIEDYWRGLDKNLFQSIQIVNDSLNKKVWFTLPSPLDTSVLHVDYSEGLDAKNIKWAVWKFGVQIFGMCLIETSKLIMSGGEGLYFINPTKSGFYDSYYSGDLKIPDPTIRTALLGA
jgi:hypothetical protein